MHSSMKFDIGGLLRDPGVFVVDAKEAGGFGKIVGFLALLTLVGTMLFGAALGAFVDWRVALLDAVKLSGVVFFAFALCYPTMYVFAYISGSRLSPLRLLGLGLISTATLGCLLAALAPILWLFSVSSESVGFLLLFACALGGIGLLFAYRPIVGAVAKGVIASDSGFKVWFVIFIIVALQAVTLVRPMLSPVGAARVPAEKCFFLQHFVKSFSGSEP